MVDYVNVKFYDEEPEDVFAPPDGLKLKNYKDVLAAFEKVVPKNKIVMGFEPGPQYSGGVWEGFDTDHTVIDYLKKNGYGGVFFWSINEPKIGDNTLKLADYTNNN